ncbi:hypothetical protein EWH91_11235 [Sporolactobacillus sp. THM19-2]|nr:hypothetical protein EWH91_11235 [Sporolactobacillus sp. THM19-2]
MKKTVHMQGPSGYPPYLSFIPHERQHRPRVMRANEQARAGITSRSSPMGTTKNQWGIKPPLIDVSLHKKFFTEKGLGKPDLCDAGDLLSLSAFLIEACRP